MKIILVLIAASLFPKIIFSQNDLVSNSFEYAFVNSPINYRYVEENQTHDYSGNWDFDGDDVKDSIMFVGIGGTHLYFYLRIYLSSEKKMHDFNFLVTDYPLLEPIDSLFKHDEQAIFPLFVVYDFNKDGLMDIYMNIQGQSAVGLPKKLVSSYNYNPIIAYYNVIKQRIVIEKYKKTL